MTIPEPKKILIELSSEEHEIAQYVLRKAYEAGETYVDTAGRARSHTISSVVKLAVEAGLTDLAKRVRESGSLEYQG